MSLRSFTESIYISNLLLKAAKIKQNNMEHMIRTLENYNGTSEKYKTEKTSTLLNAKQFYKGRKMILIAFENNIFLLPKQFHQVWIIGKDMRWILHNSCLRKRNLGFYYHYLSVKNWRKKKYQKSMQVNLINQLLK